MRIKDRNGLEIWQAIDAAVYQLETVFHHIDSYAPKFESQRRIQSVQTVLERARRPFKFGILGEFNSGKSSLINVLANRDIALIDEMELTAVLCRYTYADIEGATIRFTDGREQHLTVSEANSWFSERRHDVEWLQQIQEVCFQFPCDHLNRVELWDTPGLAGSSFNEQLARRFVTEVDAAIWVFDANYIGGSHIAGVISELRDRGKHIIVVVNKCEEWTQNEMSGVSSTLRRSYPPLQNSAVILFSAWMARNFQQNEEGEFYGDLPQDGGLQALIDCLEDEILQDPMYLTAKAAAGDLRAIIGSAEDWLQRERAQIDRLLWLLERQEEQVKKRVGPRLQRLASELSDEMGPALQDHMLQRTRKKLSDASIAELQNDQWVEDQLMAAWNLHEVQEACDTFAKTQSRRVAAVLSQLGLDQKAHTLELLTPLERNRLLPSGQMDSKPDPGHLTSNHYAIANIDLKSAAVGASALVGIAALIAFPIPTALFAAGMALGRYFSHSGSRTLTHQQWRELRWNQCHRAIHDRLHDLKSSAYDWLSREMRRIENAATEAILQEQREELLKGQNLDSLQHLHELYTQSRTALKAIGMRLEEVAGLNEIASLQSGELLLPSGDSERRQNLLKTIFNEARAGFSMTDGELDHTALQLLIDLPTETPIRILTWKQPLSLGVSDIFAAQVDKLRELRRGEVTVAVLQQVEMPATSMPNDLRPTGCWIFTDNGAYHFDTSLGELLQGGREHAFTSEEQVERFLEECFLRWWENRVDGYQTVYLM